MTHVQTLSRTVTAIAATALLSAGSLLAQTATAAPPSSARITKEISWLADDAREGRGVGTAGLDQAADFIAKAFAEIGLEPGGTDGYFQPFQLDPDSPALAHTDFGGAAVKNVVGILPGTGSLAGQVVVLGAHYDHLGQGNHGYETSSRDTAAVKGIQNGADDNASGTVALIETARVLAGRQASDRRTFVFVAFTAEELGTIGSVYYVEHPARPLESTDVMLNFDMVGRLSGDSLTVGGTGSAEELSAVLDRANVKYRLNLGKQADPWGASDHAVFYAKDIPVLHFYTQLHQDYHTSQDDWDKINMVGIADVVGFASDVAWELATSPAEVTYLAFERPAPPAGGPRASLGTMPDMVSSGLEGMRVQGVREGTAAAEAGIKAGDIILQIGDVVVKDVYGLQEALTTYKTGETVTIVFLRDGERMETKATLK
jgi:hypothetical protein